MITNYQCQYCGTVFFDQTSKSIVQRAKFQFLQHKKIVCPCFPFMRRPLKMTFTVVNHSVTP